MLLQSAMIVKSFVALATEVFGLVNFDVDSKPVLCLIFVYFTQLSQFPLCLFSVLITEGSKSPTMALSLQHVCGLQAFTDIQWSKLIDRLMESSARGPPFEFKMVNYGPTSVVNGTATMPWTVTNQAQSLKTLEDCVKWIFKVIQKPTTWT